MEQEDDIGGLDLGKTLYAKDMEEIYQKAKLERFEAEFKKILEQEDEDEKQLDEIPPNIRQMCNLPTEMGEF